MCISTLDYKRGAERKVEEYCNMKEKYERVVGYARQ